VAHCDTRCDKLDFATLEILARDGQQLRIPQIGLDEVVRQVPRVHALENEFPLHELIVRRPATHSFDQVVVSR
jgi:hypothetical protein